MAALQGSRTTQAAEPSTTKVDSLASTEDRKYKEHSPLRGWCSARTLSPLIALSSLGAVEIISLPGS